MDQSEGVVAGEPLGGNPGTQATISQPGDDQQKRPRSTQPKAIEIAKDGDQKQINVTPELQGVPSHLAGAHLNPDVPKHTEKNTHDVLSNQAEDQDTGFRHPRKQRRDILRGHSNSNPAEGQKTSWDRHREVIVSVHLIRLSLVQVVISYMLVG